MNVVRLRIPRRFEGGALRIKDWVEGYARSVGHPVLSVLGRELDSEVIWVEYPYRVTREQFQAVENAVSILNDRIRNQVHAVWMQHISAIAELQPLWLKVDRMFAEAERQPHPYG